MDAPSEKTLSPEDEELLRDSLKRCSPETVEAALAYRKTGDVERVSTIILGIVERFLEPDIRPRLRSGGDGQRIFEDLGIDSLTLVEIVMLVEETLDMSINNDELRDLRTVGDVKLFIDCKLKGLPLPERARHVTIEEIFETLPHGQPFLFLKEAALRKSEAIGNYAIAGDEFFLEGHFKDNPVFPASIMLEALGQLAVLYLIMGADPEVPGKVDKHKVMFTSCDGVRCTRVCKPGDSLSLTIRPKRIKHPVATFEGSITVGAEKVAFAEEISLMFDFCSEGHSEAGETGTTSA